MHYINDENSKVKTYDEVVDVAIKNGIYAKRVYIYLAGLGVHGELGRILDNETMRYSRPIKLAVINDIPKGKHYFVTKLEICKECKGLVIG